MVETKTGDPVLICRGLLLKEFRFYFVNQGRVNF